MSTQPITQELLHKLGTDFDQFKSYNSRKLSDTEATLREEIQKSGTATASQYMEIQARVEKAEQQNKENMALIEQLATKLARGNAYSDSGEDPKEVRKSLKMFNDSRRSAWLGKAYDQGRSVEVGLEEATAYKSAYDAWTRYGDRGLNDMQTKALAVGSDPDGGAWIAPPEKANYIVSRVFETSPMRQVSNVISISGHSFSIPMDPNRMPTGGWVAEMQPRLPTATPTLAVKEIVPQEIYAQPAITQIMLEDAGFDVQAYLADKASQAFALDENNAFVTGSGVGKPHGFLTYPAGSNGDGTNKWGEIEQILTGSSGAFTYNGLLKIITSFRGDKYYGNLQWMLKRTSIVPLIQLTNPSGQYIFQPILNGEFNATPLLGYKINFANDMPAMAAGAIAAALGNWNMGYTIVDRVGISTLRDVYTAKPFVLYYMRKRVGGDVVDYDAIKLLRLS